MKTSCERMHEIAVSLARREHAPYIVFKEFPAGDCPKMDFLQQLGYRRFSSPAMNTFGRRFAGHRLLRRRPPEPVSAVCAQVAGEVSCRRPAIRTADRHGRDPAPVRPVSPSALRGGRPFLGAPPRAPAALVLPQPGTAPTRSGRPHARVRRRSRRRVQLEPPPRGGLSLALRRAGLRLEPEAWTSTST